MISTARDLIEKDYQVTPVKEKRPYLKDWPNIENVLDQDWSRADGLGIILGPASGLICLDIDCQFPELEKMLPPIFCGVIGNRARPPARFFRYNGEKSEKFNKIHVEILADKNQKVIPPSKHPSGSMYKYVGHTLLNADIDDFPDLDGEVINFLRRENGSTNIAQEFDITDDKRCAHGSHNSLSEFAVRFFHQGWTFEDIVFQCIEKDKEINEKVKYFKCPTRKWRTDNVPTNARQFVGEIFKNRSYQDFNTKTFFQEERANGFTFNDPDKPESKPRRLHVALYNYMKCVHDIWYCPKIKGFQVWDGKKYNVESDEFVMKFAQDNFKHPSCTIINDKQAFLHYAKHAQQCDVKEFLLHDKKMINLQNGILDLKTMKLIKHHKKHKMTYLINVPWGDDSEAPKWDKFLELVTMNRSHMALAIEEFIGYALSGCDYKRFNKLLILDGEGSNGKSTLIRIIQAIIDPDNTSSESLISITNNKFSAFNLVNKLANFCSEEPKEAFANTGAIKKITGGDSVSAEEKHKGAFQYFNIAKLIISYNKMPFFPDDSSGMRRRIILIPCDMKFKKDEHRSPEDFIYAHERPQILRRCVMAYMEVVKRGSFTDVAEGDARVEEMIMDSNPIYSFISECIKVTGAPDDHVSIASTYSRFEEWQGGYSKINKNNFCKRFLQRVNRDRTNKILSKSVRDSHGNVFKAYVGIQNVI